MDLPTLLIYAFAVANGVSAFGAMVAMAFAWSGGGRWRLLSAVLYVVAGLDLGACVWNWGQA